MILLARDRALFACSCQAVYLTLLSMKRPYIRRRPGLLCWTAGAMMGANKGRMRGACITDGTQQS
jgi:hypothetical protein